MGLVRHYADRGPDFRPICARPTWAMTAELANPQ